MVYWVFLFVTCSHQVPKLPMFSSTCSQQHHTFIPYALLKVVLFSPIYVGQREGIPSLYRNFDFQEHPKISNFFWCNGLIKMANCENKKLSLGEKHYLLGTLWNLHCGIIYNRIISSYDLVYTLVTNKNKICDKDTLVI